MSAYFVTGTGTGIGKTFTTCAMLHAARGNAQGYKPVISGWNGGEDTDTHQLIAAGAKGTAEEISPWRFAAPLSPHRAAVLEHRQINVPELITWTHARAAQPGLTLIETVGGVMVPLTDHLTTLDWLRAVKLPVILVMGSYLGTISHTLTAIQALRHVGLAIHALILNESEGSSVTLAEAQIGLAPFTGDIALRIVQPRVSSWKDATAIHDVVKNL